MARVSIDTIRTRLKLQKEEDSEPVEVETDDHYCEDEGELEYKTDYSTLGDI